MPQTIRTVSYLWIKNNKVLMVRARNNDKLYLPGGKIDSGESDETAIRREVQEELNITSIDNLHHAFHVEAPAHGRVNTICQMNCFMGKIQQTPEASAEITELKWVSMHDLELCAPAGQEAMKKLYSLGLLFSSR